MLPSHRTGIHYLDRVRVYVEGDRVLYARDEGGMQRSWNIPDLSTAVVLLGPGASITQAAARRFAESGVMLAFTGTGATPLFLSSQSEYRPTDRLQRWMAVWSDAGRRLAAAKRLQELRCQMIAKAWPRQFKGHKPQPRWQDVVDDFRDVLPGCRTVQQLMSHEDHLVAALYKEASRAIGLPWKGRSERFDEDKDSANTFLNHGNDLAYGIAAFALWATGIPAGLPVTHGMSRAGGLVFDLADVIKDAVILPRAFLAAANNADPQDFRDAAVADLHDFDAIPLMFDAVDQALSAMEAGTTGAAE